MSTDVVKTKSAKDTIFDMVRSLGLIVVILGLTLLFVPGLLHPSKSQRVQPVDFSPVVIGFHQVNGIDALVPAQVPSGWTATSQRLVHNTAFSYGRLHIGFASPGSTYAGLEEAPATPPTLVQTILGAKGLTSTGSVTVNGQVWSERTSQAGEMSLVRTTRGVTVVITGSAPLSEQEALATSLRPSAH